MRCSRKGPGWQLRKQRWKLFYFGPSLSPLHNRNLQIIKELIQCRCPLLSKGWGTVVFFLPYGVPVVTEPGVFQGIGQRLPQLEVDGL